MFIDNETVNHPGISSKINLFCLPFAGSSIYSYRDLTKYTADYINIIPLELSGRGNRISDPLLSDINKMVEDIFDQIKNDINNHYAIFGHSIGSILGYLLVKKIISKKLQLPVHLFFTGRGAPGAKERHIPIHSLPKDQFWKKIREYEGTPEEVLNDNEIMDFFEPILRADFRAIETYHYKKSEPFHIAMTVMIGSNENITMEDAMKWQDETTKKIVYKQFKGGHFFIFNNIQEISAIISNTLREVILPRPL